MEKTGDGVHGETREGGHRGAIERVILSMTQHLDSGMSLKEMARVAFISPFHFNRIFRSEVGIPPCHFLTALRIQAAKRLLASSQDRIINVCMDVGFTSPGTFSRRFRDLIGLAPLQFRRLAGRLIEVCRQRAGRSALAATVPPETETLLAGEIAGPPGFSGKVFIGLFKTPLPHSRPVACCYLEKGPGRFQIATAPDGDYYLLALGFADSAQAIDLMMADTALRAGSTHRPIAIRGGQPTAPIRLELRPPEITDPPILVTIPYLLTRLASLGLLAQQRAPAKIEYY